MTINIGIPDVEPNLRPQITVLGVGGSGGNAVNNMMLSNLEGVDFLIANTDAQALQISKCDRRIQLGLNSTKGLGAGMRPDVGREAAEEAIQEISDKLEGSHMIFIAAGMGGGTGTGAAPVIAKLAREKGILTVGVVTKPFHFEGSQRMKLAEKGISELQKYVDTLLIIPNQNLFRIANEKTTFADAFKMADDVLYAGVRGVTDLMVQPGLINLDFSDVKTVMSEMGKAMMGTGEATGEGRAIAAAEAAIANPLIDDVSLKGARGLIINITGGNDITLYEVDEAANRIKQEIDESANIIYGTTCDERLEGVIRISIVATGIDASIHSPVSHETNHAPLSIDNTVYQNSLLEDENKHEDYQIAQNSLNDNHLNKKVSSENDSILASPDKDENMTDETYAYVNENSHEDLSHKFSENENISPEIQDIVKDNAEENEIEKFESLDQNKPTETDENSLSVKRLSLFDNLDEKDLNQKIANESETMNSKLEPMLENQETQENLSNEDHFSGEFETDGSISDNDEIDQKNDQENEEEELLDIPTFLRRQAN